MHEMICQVRIIFCVVPTPLSYVLIYIELCIDIYELTCTKMEALPVAISEVLTSRKKLSWSVWDNGEITSVKLLWKPVTSSVGNSTQASGHIAPQTLAQCQKETLTLQLEKKQPAAEKLSRKEKQSGKARAWYCCRWRKSGIPGDSNQCTPTTSSVLGNSYTLNQFSNCMVSCSSHLLSMHDIRMRFS